jgi:hypothetical protein
VSSNIEHKERDKKINILENVLDNLFRVSPKFQVVLWHIESCFQKTTNEIQSWLCKIIHFTVPGKAVGYFLPASGLQAIKSLQGWYLRSFKWYPG